MSRPSGPTISRKTRTTSNRRQRGATRDGSPPFPGAALLDGGPNPAAWDSPRPGSDPQLSQLVQPDVAGILLSRRDIFVPSLSLLGPVASLAEECVARCDERCRAQQIDGELANRTLLCAAVLANAGTGVRVSCRAPGFPAGDINLSNYRAVGVAVGVLRGLTAPREAVSCAKTYVSENSRGNRTAGGARVDAAAVYFFSER